MENTFNYGMERFSEEKKNDSRIEQWQKFVKVTGFVETDEMKALRDDRDAWKKEAEKMIDLKAAPDSHIHRNLTAGMLMQIAIIESEKGDEQKVQDAVDESIDFFQKNNLDEEVDRIAA